MSNLISTMSRNLRPFLIIPEAIEQDFIIFDFKAFKSEVIKALDESPIHFAAYPAPHELSGTDDGYYVIVNPNPLDEKPKKFHGLAKGMLWIHPDGNKALFDHKESVERYFKYVARMESIVNH